MRKKWLVWVICLALAFSALTGCSKAQTSEPAEETVEETADETKDIPEESDAQEPEEEPAEEETEAAEAPAEEPSENVAGPAPAAAAAQQPAEPAPQQPAAADPAPAETPAEQPAEEEPSTGIADGTYTISIGFSGGTGKASITSPVTLYVKNGAYSAKVVWTSMYYDYMKVNGTKYTNENVGGNSTFTIPVPALDTYFNVIGDTTAMSTPHEIEYTLYFDSTTIH